MKKIFPVLMALIGSAGVIYLIISDYYGGAFIHLLSYGMILLPLLGIYFVSRIFTLRSIAKAGIRENKLHVAIVSIPVILFFVSCIHAAEFHNSSQVLITKFNDGRSYYTLVFTEE